MPSRVSRFKKIGDHEHFIQARGEISMKLSPQQREAKTDIVATKHCRTSRAFQGHALIRPCVRCVFSINCEQQQFMVCLDTGGNSCENVQCVRIIWTGCRSRPILLQACNLVVSRTRVDLPTLYRTENLLRYATSLFTHPSVLQTAQELVHDVGWLRL